MEQTEMWKISDQERLNTAVNLLNKIYKSEQGLFKRLAEIKKERETLTAILEDINHNQIYGHSEILENWNEFANNGSEHD